MLRLKLATSARLTKSSDEGHALQPFRLALEGYLVLYNNYYHSKIKSCFNLSDTVSLKSLVQ